MLTGLICTKWCRVVGVVYEVVCSSVLVQLLNWWQRSLHFRVRLDGEIFRGHILHNNGHIHQHLIGGVKLSTSCTRNPWQLQCHNNDVVKRFAPRSARSCLDARKQRPGSIISADGRQGWQGLPCHHACSSREAGHRLGDRHN
ncbi:hypothetical protein SKAU_G00090120 [Synaphobranchus kaupii]|uniref:Uncharacterized protein n=1 Tax=Synaphobranchus kaupii TaxID=118154 RepID=A0A9Q1FX29_SYNKA|nr:hypothetical protein SKAU_G00090120 [Synaphobranchus kaupii]